MNVHLIQRKLFNLIKVAHNLGKPFPPSAFQVRCAGYKGVLAFDPTLEGKKASFRPSMRKFESTHNRLEVTHTSQAQRVYLNHQVIMLLSNLGVPDDAFIALQKAMLDKLAGTFNWLDYQLEVIPIKHPKNLRGLPNITGVL